MSLSAGLQFQQNLYKSLEKDMALRGMIDNVYQTVKSNAKYPYILQRVNSIKILQTNPPFIYEIIGEINVYSRDNTFSNFAKIISKVEEIFTLNNRILTSYVFISGKLQEAEFSASQDMLTTKIRLGYEVLIQGGIMSGEQ